MKKANESEKKPRRASTVLLIRQTVEGLQVYLMRRSSGSAFMPGKYVFPGGMVDPEDGDPEFWKNYMDLDLKEVLRRYGSHDLTDKETVAHCVAAIRETFEESGVLLAGQSSVSPNRMRSIREKRVAGNLGPGWLKELVAEGNLTLAFSRLGRWSHWITPKARSLRFDTRFFLVFMPSGQECVPDSRETTHGIWSNPEAGLLGNLTGEIPLSPPAVVTLHELLRYRHEEDLKIEMESHEWGQTRIPLLKRFTKGSLLMLPWDPCYTRGIEDKDPAYTVKACLSPGEPFSRLWNQDSIWRPVPCDPI